MSLEKKSNPGLHDVLTGTDIRHLNKYILGKTELEKPRELSPEEEKRLKFRRRLGWSLFNPLYDNEKRDVFQHIQNPTYRAATDAMGSAVGGAILPAYLGVLLGGALGSNRNHALFSAAMATMGALPGIVTIKNKYKQQKIYNDIVEEYIRNHPEGDIENMSNILKEMTKVKRSPSELKATKVKIKSASLHVSPRVLDVLHKIRTYWPIFPAAVGLGAGVAEYRMGKRNLNDLQDRFERKKQEKRDADIFVKKVKMPLYKRHEGTEDKIRAFEAMFDGEKAAADKSEMLPHQKRVVDRLMAEDQPGLILMHGLGSGKTRSSIEAYKKLGLPTEVILPAALRENYQKELKKWVGRVPKDIEIKSQQEVARKGIDPELLKDKLMVIDEAHRLRNEDTKLYSHLKKVQPKKRLLLTGTPIYNHPGDIAKLVNVAAGRHILPERQPEFEQEFIARKTVFPTIGHRMLGVSPGQELSLKNKEYLRAVFRKLVDYHAGNAEGFPSVSEETVKVPMAEKQQQIYRAVMKKLPWHLRLKVQSGLPPNRKELEKLMPFLSGARMVSNSTAGFDKPDNVVSPKIDKAFDYLSEKIKQDPNYKALVYSNYLESGVNQYKRRLEEAGIPYGEFTGDIRDTVRNQLVRDYNANKLKALIVSSAGGEGLDLKGTRLVQLLEPHFNTEKIKQVIGRAARYRSHDDLPEDQRNILVQRYLSTLNPNALEKLRMKNPTSTDEYLQSMADQKERLNREFVKLIEEANGIRSK